MIQPNEQYAYFSVANSFAPEDLTTRLGVTPSDAWKKGDLHPRTQRERKFSRWCLGSRLPRTELLEDHIADVLAQLDHNSDEFVAVSKEFGGCIQLISYMYEAYPGLHFDANIVAGLARYGLTVDFDFYFLWSDSREDT